MKGTWNPETNKYETKKVNKLDTDDRTYLERYAEELGVDEVELFKNILANNTMERFNSVRSYYEFTMLKQTLVEETGIMGHIKRYANIYSGM